MRKICRHRSSHGSARLAALCGMVFVAGCGGSDSGNVPTSTTVNSSTLGASQRSQASYRGKSVHHDQAACNMLYSFQGTDGAHPGAGLTAIKDTLYGTTEQGGTYYYGGTVFSYKSGTETVLHDFTGAPDGASPYAGLLDVGKTLYGTTLNGGTYNDGTVFSITADGGKYRVLHSFAGALDGANPTYAGLINVGGTLYGTTSSGGTGRYSAGTVYSITKSGVEKVIYNFQNTPDGGNPEAGLIYYKGAFYGTTYNGGTAGMGTVFKLTPDGTETVLHSFTGQPDGENTIGSLLEYKGNFYGTNQNGGADGYGSVFKVSPSGEESVLHSFPVNGYSPRAGLIEVKGTFYGTSYGYNQPGPIFSVTPEGVENVVCTFMGSGKTYSLAPLLYFDGALYGSTFNEGSEDYGGIFNVAL